MQEIDPGARWRVVEIGSMGVASELVGHLPFQTNSPAATPLCYFRCLNLLKRAKSGSTLPLSEREVKGWRISLHCIILSFPT